VPIGLNLRQHPGPYHAEWSDTVHTDLWLAEGVLIDARQSAARAVTISGSGFYSRTFILPSDGPQSWRVAADWTRAAPAALARLAEARQAHRFWARWLPLALGIAALVVALPALHDRRPARRHAKQPFRFSSIPHEGQRNATD
jgi:high-affinity iron transporter